MGIPSQHIPGKPHHIQNSIHILRHGGRRGYVMIQHGLGQDFINMLPWIQGRIGILENHLQLCPDFFHFPGLTGGQILTVIIYLPFGRILQPHDLPSDSRLPAAGFPNQSQRLSLHYGKAHAVHRFHISCGMSNNPTLDGIILFHVFHFNQGNLVSFILSHSYFSSSFITTHFALCFSPKE